MLEQHFVTFVSPGTFVAETSGQSIESWDVAKALEVAKTSIERHGARPYCFFFTTRGREDHELDSREVARSPNYFFGVRVETREEVEARNDSSESILRSNMRNNDITRIAITLEGWKVCVPVRDDDIIID